MGKKKNKSISGKSNPKDHIPDVTIFLTATSMTPKIIQRIIAECQTPLFYHKFILCGAQSYDRNYVLKSVMDFLYPTSFTVVQYSETKTSSTFLSRNCLDVIMKIISQKFLVPHRLDPENPFKVVIKANCKISEEVPVEDNSSIIQSVIKKRFTPETKMLDLNNFSDDIDLIEYIPLFNNKCFQYVMKQAEELAPRIVDLQNNYLRDISSISILKSSVEVLDLSNNEIEDINTLTPLTEFVNLRSLSLSGNPLCEKYNNYNYAVDIKMYCQKLQKLDGCTVGIPEFRNGEHFCTPANPEFKKNFVCTEDGEDLAAAFVEYFFSRYDSSDRTALKELYHPLAVFSVNAKINPGQNNSETVKLQHYGLDHPFTVCGIVDILKLYRDFPRTCHDPYPVICDVTVYTDLHAHLVVCGIFKEFNQVLSFNRSFYFLRIGEQFLITNEQLHVSNALNFQIGWSFRFPSNVELTETPLPYFCEQYQELEIFFKKLTGVNLEYSQKYLVYCNYDLKKALNLFSELHINNEVPQEAFLKDSWPVKKRSKTSICEALRKKVSEKHPTISLKIIWETLNKERLQSLSYPPIIQNPTIYKIYKPHFTKITPTQPRKAFTEVPHYSNVFSNSDITPKTQPIFVPQAQNINLSQISSILPAKPQTALDLHFDTTFSKVILQKPNVKSNLIQINTSGLLPTTVSLIDTKEKLINKDEPKTIEKESPSGDNKRSKNVKSRRSRSRDREHRRSRSRDRRSRSRDRRSRSRDRRRSRSKDRRRSRSRDRKRSRSRDRRRSRSKEDKLHSSSDRKRSRSRERKRSRSLETNKDSRARGTFPSPISTTKAERKANPITINIRETISKKTKAFNAVPPPINYSTTKKLLVNQRFNPTRSQAENTTNICNISSINQKSVTPVQPGTASTELTQFVKSPIPLDTQSQPGTSAGLPYPYPQFGSTSLNKQGQPGTSTGLPYPCPQFGKKSLNEQPQPGTSTQLPKASVKVPISGGFVYTIPRLGTSAQLSNAGINKIPIPSGAVYTIPRIGTYSQSPYQQAGSKEEPKTAVKVPTPTVPQPGTSAQSPKQSQQIGHKEDPKAAVKVPRPTEAVSTGTKRSLAKGTSNTSVKKSIYSLPTVPPTVVPPKVVPPTVVKPTILQPTIGQPTVVQPKVVEPQVVQPTTVQPTTVQPTITQPINTDNIPKIRRDLKQQKQKLIGLKNELDAVINPGSTQETKDSQPISATDKKAKNEFIKSLTKNLKVEKEKLLRLKGDLDEKMALKNKHVLIRPGASPIPKLNISRRLPKATQNALYKYTKKDVQLNALTGSDEAAKNTQIKNMLQKVQEEKQKLLKLKEQMESKSQNTSTDKSTTDEDKTVDKTAAETSVANKSTVDTSPAKTSVANKSLENNSPENKSTVIESNSEQATGTNQVTKSVENEGITSRKTESKQQESSDSGKGGSDVVTPPPYHEFIISQSLVGKLIGKHGSFVALVKDKTNAMIKVRSHPANNKMKICSVKGTKIEIDNALKMIRQAFPLIWYPEVTLEQVHLDPEIPTVSLIPDHLLAWQKEQLKEMESLPKSVQDSKPLQPTSKGFEEKQKLLKLKEKTESKSQNTSTDKADANKSTQETSTPETSVANKSPAKSTVDESTSGQATGSNQVTESIGNEGVTSNKTESEEQSVQPLNENENADSKPKRNSLSRKKKREKIKEKIKELNESRRLGVITEAEFLMEIRKLRRNKKSIPVSILSKPLQPTSEESALKKLKLIKELEERELRKKRKKAKKPKESLPDPIHPTALQSASEETAFNELGIIKDQPKFISESILSTPLQPNTEESLVQPMNKNENADNELVGRRRKRRGRRERKQIALRKFGLIEPPKSLPDSILSTDLQPNSEETALRKFGLIEPPKSLPVSVLSTDLQPNSEESLVQPMNKNENADSEPVKRRRKRPGRRQRKQMALRKFGLIGPPKSLPVSILSTDLQPNSEESSVQPMNENENADSVPVQPMNENENADSQPVKKLNNQRERQRKRAVESGCSLLESKIENMVLDDKEKETSEITAQQEKSTEELKTKYPDFFRGVTVCLSRLPDAEIPKNVLQSYELETMEFEELEEKRIKIEIPKLLRSLNVSISAKERHYADSVLRTQDIEQPRIKTEVLDSDLEHQLKGKPESTPTGTLETSADPVKLPKIPGKKTSDKIETSIQVKIEKGEEHNTKNTTTNKNVANKHKGDGNPESTPTEMLQTSADPLKVNKTPRKKTSDKEETPIQVKIEKGEEDPNIKNTTSNKNVRNRPKGKGKPESSPIETLQTSADPVKVPKISRKKTSEKVETSVQVKIEKGEEDPKSKNTKTNKNVSNKPKGDGKPESTTTHPVKVPKTSGKKTSDEVETSIQVKIEKSEEDHNTKNVTTNTNVPNKPKGDGKPDRSPTETLQTSADPVKVPKKLVKKTSDRVETSTQVKTEKGEEDPNTKNSKRDRNVPNNPKGDSKTEIAPTDPVEVPKTAVKKTSDKVETSTEAKTTKGEEDPNTKNTKTNQNVPNDPKGDGKPESAPTDQVKVPKTPVKKTSDKVETSTQVKTKKGEEDPNTKNTKTNQNVPNDPKDGKPESAPTDPVKVPKTPVKKTSDKAETSTQAKTKKGEEDPNTKNTKINQNVPNDPKGDGKPESSPTDPVKVPKTPVKKTSDKAESSTQAKTKKGEEDPNTKDTKTNQNVPNDPKLDAKPESAPTDPVQVPKTPVKKTSDKVETSTEAKTTKGEEDPNTKNTKANQNVPNDPKGDGKPESSPTDPVKVPKTPVQKTSDKVETSTQAKTKKGEEDPNTKNTKTNQNVPNDTKGDGKSESAPTDHVKVPKTPVKKSSDKVETSTQAKTKKGEEDPNTKNTKTNQHDPNDSKGDGKSESTPTDPVKVPKTPVKKTSDKAETSTQAKTKKGEEDPNTKNTKINQNVPNDPKGDGKPESAPTDQVKVPKTPVKKTSDKVETSTQVKTKKGEEDPNIKNTKTNRNVPNDPKIDGKPESSPTDPVKVPKTPVKKTSDKVDTSTQAKTKKGEEDPNTKNTKINQNVPNDPKGDGKPESAPTDPVKVPKTPVKKTSDKVETSTQVKTKKGEEDPNTKNTKTNQNDPNDSKGDGKSESTNTDPVKVPKTPVKKTSDKAETSTQAKTKKGEEDPNTKNTKINQNVPNDPKGDGKPESAPTDPVKVPKTPVKKTSDKVETSTQAKTKKGEEHPNTKNTKTNQNVPNDPKGDGKPESAPTDPVKVSKAPVMKTSDKVETSIQVVLEKSEENPDTKNTTANKKVPNKPKGDDIAKGEKSKPLENKDKIIKSVSSESNKEQNISAAGTVAPDNILLTTINAPADSQKKVATSSVDDSNTKLLESKNTEKEKSTPNDNSKQEIVASHDKSKQDRDSLVENPKRETPSSSHSVNSKQELAAAKDNLKQNTAVSDNKDSAADSGDNSKQELASGDNSRKEKPDVPKQETIMNVNKASSNVNTELSVSNKDQSPSSKTADSKLKVDTAASSDNSSASLTNNTNKSKLIPASSGTNSKKEKIDFKQDAAAASNLKPDTAASNGSSSASLTNKTNNSKSIIASSRNNSKNEEINASSDTVGVSKKDIPLNANKSLSKTEKSNVTNKDTLTEKSAENKNIISDSGKEETKLKLSSLSPDQSSLSKEISKNKETKNMAVIEKKTDKTNVSQPDIAKSIGQNKDAKSEDQPTKCVDKQEKNSASISSSSTADTSVKQKLITKGAASDKIHKDAKSDKPTKCVDKQEKNLASTSSSSIADTLVKQKPITNVADSDTMHKDAKSDDKPTKCVDKQEKNLASTSSTSTVDTSVKEESITKDATSYKTERQKEMPQTNIKEEKAQLGETSTIQGKLESKETGQNSNSDDERGDKSPLKFTFDLDDSDSDDAIDLNFL